MKNRVARGVTAGFISLMVVMGIGRFLYTPLLPPMMQEYRFGADQAGLLASLNYVGYLVGAFSAGPLCHRFREHRVLAAGLLLSCATTAATGLFTAFPAVCAARLLAGAASAFAFVAVSGLVLLILAHEGRESLAGLYYGGVGAGIVVTGLTAAPAAARLGTAATWVAFGVAALPLAACVLFLLRHEDPHAAGGRAVKDPLPWAPSFLRLVASYGLEGFGYIITGTFMVAAANASIGPSGARIAWIVAGCAACPSAFLWSTAARSYGRLKPLLFAYLLQAVGVALPALVTGAVAVIAGAALFGATFMGIVTLALAEGASFAPSARARTVGFMTGVYGIGQIVGPALAGYFSARTGSFRIALFTASAAVVTAGALLVSDAFKSTEEKEG